MELKISPEAASAIYEIIDVLKCHGTDEIAVQLKFNMETGALEHVVAIMQNDKPCSFRVMTPVGYKPLGDAFVKHDDMLPTKPGEFLPEQTTVDIIT